MKQMLAAACLAFASTAALGAEPLFGFKPDGFHAVFNSSATARKTERFVGAPQCKPGPPVVCEYRFTSVIRATVSADQADANANEVTVVFARPTHNIKGHTLISYRIYGDVVHALSPNADAAARGAAVKRLLSALHTANKEVIEVGAVRYALDMKRTGVRFAAKPMPTEAAAPKAY
ncbi:MAG TPA: hypothetical protein VHN20_05805 [Beijerinckiaceae bacterium]|nr:hypothetical protein [Beijerinckiaceae bacterium]